MSMVEMKDSYFEFDNSFQKLFGQEKKHIDMIEERQKDPKLSVFKQSYPEIMLRDPHMNKSHPKMATQPDLESHEQISLEESLQFNNIFNSGSFNEIYKAKELMKDNKFLQ